MKAFLLSCVFTLIIRFHIRTASSVFRRLLYQSIYNFIEEGGPTSALYQDGTDLSLYHKPR
ncbi:MAG: hypothetical protein IPK08_23880 [Bacteroidetes bacterium]|nr:hypothetical protein [Bacteroidota bacterium]